MARNLSVLLPTHLNVLSETTSRIDPRKVIAHTKGQPFDMLCNHLIFDENEIGKYVSKTAFRFAIVRDPMKQALSALTYYTNVYPSQELLNGLRKHQPDPINGFLQHPEDFASVPSPAWSFVNNRMSIDLGFDLENFKSSKKDTTKKKAFLKKLEKQFDVILISDYFDESLVLLRRMLRWSLKDIIYLKVNTGKQIAKSSAWNKVPRINKTTIDRFRQWAAIDYDLYEYFLQIFKTKLENEFSFRDEVKTFREIQQDVRDFCSNKTNIGDLRIQHNLWTKEFLVSKTDCKLMDLMEMDIIDVARSLQIDRYRSQLKQQQQQRRQHHHHYHHHQKQQQYKNNERSS
ncbi:galactose-3-o-sulfotransferase 3 [Plakobranchus ocellatus]|uniref:Galactose-3-o-sulfotransferase 3 n=1 Tax=Plakobranchus ocellatus TaxID=259542 RepID=A0AAV4A7L7_9GAST|nr:galactose-3-o-sulfotransferase 3 [Plakobranchus ocellatus]